MKFFTASLGALAAGAALAAFSLEVWNAARLSDAGWILDEHAPGTCFVLSFPTVAS